MWKTAVRWEIGRFQERELFSWMHVSQNIVVTAKTFWPADPESVSPAGLMIPAVLLDDLSSFVIAAFSHQFRKVNEGRQIFSSAVHSWITTYFFGNFLKLLVIFGGKFYFQGGSNYRSCALKLRLQTPPSREGGSEQASETVVQPKLPLLTITQLFGSESFYVSFLCSNFIVSSMWNQNILVNLSVLF